MYFYVLILFSILKIHVYYKTKIAYKIKLTFTVDSNVLFFIPRFLNKFIVLQHYFFLGIKLFRN